MTGPSQIPFNDEPTKDNTKQAKPFYKQVWPLVILAISVLVIILILLISNFIGGSNQNNGASQAKFSQEPSVQKTIKQQLTDITVSYSGEKTEGVQINEQTTGISVIANYNTGSKIPIISGWKITNPDVLHGGQNQTFTVDYQGVQSSFTISVELSEEQYKASTQEISYDELARNPDANMSQKIHFRGKIIQVIEGDIPGVSQYRINVTQGNYGTWENTILVQYYSTSGPRFLENDIVDIWGESTGSTTYNSVLGGKVTIPGINARYISL